MYASHRQTIEGAQRWLNMAIAYQSRAEKLSNKSDNPSNYSNSIFSCYRGYARCMQMYDACWSHIDAMNSAYFRKRDYEENKVASQRKTADYHAKQDEKFIRVMTYLFFAIIGVIFADVWISFIEWLALLLI